ncbi:hypothetical protein [Borrelia persica]|uniref:hypothetical protein n=1 Tax=Borrelia persica TaxID=44448 RepID=UPI00046580E5|nr:hypothetical protein [Borrelia persica]
MKLMYKTIILICVLLVCCGQGKDGQSAGASGDRETITLKTREKAYAELVEKFDDLVKLYDHRPKDLDPYLFNDIKNTVGTSHRIYVKDHVAFVLSGEDINDISIFTKLKDIVLTASMKSKTDYEDKDNGQRLIYALSDLSKHFIYYVLYDNDVFGIGKLNRLKESKNVKGMEFLSVQLGKMKLEWKKIVSLVRSIIEEAAMLNNEADILKKIKPIVNLKFVEEDQSCNALQAQSIDPTLCELKNNLRVLYLTIKNQVAQLIQEIDLAS